MLGIETGGFGGFVYVTLDGGRTWTPHDTPELWPVAVDFLNTNEGWLLSTNTMNVGFPACLYVTDDGGQRWSTLQSINTVLPTNIVLNGSILDFVSPTLGWTYTSSRATATTCCRRPTADVSGSACQCRLGNACVSANRVVAGCSGPDERHETCEEEQKQHHGCRERAKKRLAQQ